MRDQLRGFLTFTHIELGLMLRDVTARSGYQAGMICRLENGQFDFTIEALIQISRGFDLTLKDILNCLGDSPVFGENENEN